MSDVNIPLILLIVLAVLSFFAVLYYLWKVKNFVIEWIISSIFTGLLLGIVMLWGVPNIDFVNDIQTAVGMSALLSSFVNPILGFLVRYPLKFLVKILKRTFLFKSD